MALLATACTTHNAISPEAEVALESMREGVRGAVNDKEPGSEPQ